MKLNWGNYIFIFIILFLTLCTVFIIFSLRQDNDLVTDSYYEEGAEYSTRMEIVKRSQPYYDSIKILQRHSYITIYPSVSLSDKAKELDIWFYRPSGQKSDYRLKVDIKTDSVTLDKSKLERGRYILKIGWNMDKSDYSVEKDIFIDKSSN